MPKIAGGIHFIGTLDGITAYKTRFSDQIIVRTKGGPTKEQVRTSREFARTRENSSEFGGRSRASKAIGLLLHPQKPIADHNIYASLNKIIRPIQIQDTISDRGKRNIYFTKAPHLLQGFSLNRKNTIDSIIRTPVSSEVSRMDFTARLSIPALMPQINFFIPGKYSLFSFVASLGTLPDFVYSTHGYQPADNGIRDLPVTNSSDWFPCVNGSPELELNMEYHFPKPANDSFSLLVALGIFFGIPAANGVVQQVPYVGAGKIMAVV